MAKSESKKSIETFTHDEAKRTNIPTAEHQSVMKLEDKNPIQVAYDRRIQNKDPQLVGGEKMRIIIQIWWCRLLRFIFRKRFIPRYC